MTALQKQQTILYEVQQACLQLSLQQPTGVYDSQDETALLMGSVANLAGILLSDGYNWQELQKPFEIFGDGVTTEFDLPDDFGSFVDNTGWSYAIRRPVIVLNAQQWAAISTWLSQSFYINPACRIYQNKLQFMTAPPLSGKITFQYRSCMWVQDADNPALMKQLCTKNGDVPVYDWLMMVLAIKVKWLEQKGMNTVAAQSDLNDRYQQLTQRDLVAPTLTLSGPVPGGFRYLDNFYNSPDTGIGVP
jgi:hypothetical protein